MAILVVDVTYLSVFIATINNKHLNMLRIPVDSFLSQLLPGQVKSSQISWCQAPAGCQIVKWWNKSRILEEKNE